MPGAAQVVDDLGELNSVEEPIRPYFEGPVDEARPAVAALDQQRADSEYQIATTVPPADLAATPVGQRRIDQHPELGPTMQAQNCATELMWQLHAVGALSDADITMLSGNSEGMFSPRTATDRGNDLTPQALIEHLMWLDYEHRMRLLEQQRQQSVDPVHSDGD